jgi:hypothetical protein
MEQQKPETGKEVGVASLMSSVTGFLRTAAKGVADNVMPTYESRAEAAEFLAIFMASGAVLTTAGIYLIMLRDSVPAPVLTVGSAGLCTACGVLSIATAGHAATHLVQSLMRK